MDDSILTSIKKLLGIMEEYTHFDPDIIMHINSVCMILNQLGVGKEGFSISDSSSVWSDFTTDLHAPPIKSYIYMKVRLMFDPPTSSSMMESMKQMIQELEWRLQVGCDQTV